MKRENIAAKYVVSNSIDFQPLKDVVFLNDAA